MLVPLTFKMTLNLRTSLNGERSWDRPVSICFAPWVRQRSRSRNPVIRMRVPGPPYTVALHTSPARRPDCGGL